MGIVLLLSVSASVLAENSTLSGVVIDTTGAFIPGAEHGGPGRHRDGHNTGNGWPGTSSPCNPGSTPSQRSCPVFKRTSANVELMPGNRSR